MRVHRRRSAFMLLLAAIPILSLMIAGPWARALEAPTPKGPDVVTEGTDPYTGPTPAELAKLAAQNAGTATVPPEAKLAETATIIRGVEGPPSPAEQAKLQAVQQTLPPPVMTKLPIMVVPKDGIPELTAQEREKLAEQRAQEGPQGAPAVENNPQTSGNGQSNVNSTTPGVNTNPKENTTPTTPGKATRTDR